MPAPITREINDAKAAPPASIDIPYINTAFPDTLITFMITEITMVAVVLPFARKTAAQVL